MNRYPIHDHPPYADVGTHIPVLWAVLENEMPTSIYEFGAGLFSTRLLGAWSMKSGARLATGENDPKWSPLPWHQRHSVTKVADVKRFDATGRSIAFIDCEANLRAGLVNSILDDGECELIVVHDCEPLADRAYNMRGALSRWPYGMVVKCPYHHIDTAVMSRHHMSDKLRKALRSMTSNPAAHLIAWEAARNCWESNPRA